MNPRIEKISPNAEQAKELFNLLDEHNLTHCPPGFCHLTPPEDFKEDTSILIGVILDSVIVAMGGLKFYKGYAEITRMYTREEFRGRGFSKSILNEFEIIAKNRELFHLKLKTSEQFKSAIILYKKMGFKECDPFGKYVNKPLNTYMEKQLEQ